MKTRAVLIAYPERRFIRPLKKFEGYLNDLGIYTDFTIACEAPIVILSHVAQMVARTDPKDTLLVVFNGHGYKQGWGIKHHPKEGVSMLPYSLISLVLSKTTGRIIMVNDCCHGAQILGHLKPLRKPHNTCFIAPWDAQGICYGGAVNDVSQFWPMGKKPEDMIDESIHSGPKGDKKVPILYRWGHRLDHYFFPATSSMPT